MALEWWPPHGWPDNTPDSLHDLCLDYCLQHLEQTLCDYDSHAAVYSLKEGLSLSPSVSDRLIKKWLENGNVLNDRFLHIFKNTKHTKLKKLNLEGCNVTDDGLVWLLQHQICELNLSSCGQLSRDVLTAMNRFGGSLRSLVIGTTTQIFQDIEILDDEDSDSDQDGDPERKTIKSESGHGLNRDPILYCPNLIALSIHGLCESDFPAKRIITSILTPVKHKLCHLDLSGCETEVEYLGCLCELDSLQSLVLHEVPVYSIAMLFSHIARLKKLRWVLSFLYKQGLSPEKI